MALFKFLAAAVLAAASSHGAAATAVAAAHGAAYGAAYGAAAAAAAPPPLAAAQLRAEYLADPIVLDAPRPRFSWQPQAAPGARVALQAAYRLVVNRTSSPSSETVWDSGLVSSPLSAQVEYAGAPLQSDSVYAWAVQWVDAAAGAAPWSAAARFGTGLLAQSEWAPAAWVGCAGGANQLRAEIDVGAPAGAAVAQARLYVAAVGYYELRVNGAWAPQWAAGAARPRLDPGVTTYQERALYNAYDLTAVLAPRGPSALAFTVGHGWPIIGPSPGNETDVALAGTCVDHAQEPEFQVNDNGLPFACAAGQVFTGVAFASFGNPEGACDGSAAFAAGSCNANESAAVVERICLGRRFCNVDFATEFADPCFGVGKWFSANLTCGPAAAPAPPGAAAAARHRGAAAGNTGAAGTAASWWISADEPARRARSLAHVAARLRRPAPGDAPLQASPGGLRALLSVLTTDGRRQVWATGAAGFEGPATGNGNASWRCALGASLFDHIYDGASFDATRDTVGWDLPGFNDSGWGPAVLAADPGGAAPTIMTAQASQPVAAVAEYPALIITSPAPDVFLVDFGANLAGFVRLTLPAPVPRNATVVLRHGELLVHEPYGAADGSLYTGNLRSALATDSYTTAGSADADEVFEPKFTYHGFRFVEVSGLPFAPTLAMFTAVHSRSAAPVVGSVAFPAASARTLNQLQAAAQMSIASNLMGLQSDCPQRDERKGWLGDSALSLYAAPLSFDLAAFYSLWALSMADSQRTALDAHPPGSLPDTVPHTFAEYPADPG